MSFIISIILYVFTNFLFHSNLLKTEKIEFKVDFTAQQNFIQNSVIHSENDIQNQTIDSENIANDNTIILDETNKMDKLVKQLLELMKLEYGKREFNDKKFNIVEVEKEIIRK